MNPDKLDISKVEQIVHELLGALDEISAEDLSAVQKAERFVPIINAAVRAQPVGVLIEVISLLADQFEKIKELKKENVELKKQIQQAKKKTQEAEDLRRHFYLLRRLVPERSGNE